MKRIASLLAGALLAASALPAAAATLTVPTNGTAVAQLSWDGSSNGSASDPASVHVSSNGTDMTVRFDVSQDDPMIGTEGGDYVAVDIWPSGASGQVYRLGLNLNGTHTADSTANTASWNGSVSTHPGGYTATITVPLSSVPGIGGSDSRIQFQRWIASTGAEQSWSHDGGTNADAAAQAGTLSLASAAASQ